jgi:dUTP pyrophosphatase
MIFLHNHGTEAQTICHGDRVAQLVITPVFTPGFLEAEELSDTARGAGGFGSTGK